MTKKEIIICFSLVRRGNPYYEDNVFESKVRYSTGMLDGSRRREFERKTFKSDLLFSLAMGHGTAMAEYLARVITGRRDLVIERVLSQKKLINEWHSVRLDALAIAKDGTLINYEMQNERMHGMEQRMRMYESSINLSFLAKGDDYGNLPDIISIVFHDYDVYGLCILQIGGRKEGRLR